jgi:arabinan endo-1,5-alpha-L-arabinosidase
MINTKPNGFILFMLLTCFINCYINPVQRNFDSPDPGVIRDIDGMYYATTTGGFNSQKFPIWKSKDLGSWALVGYAFNTSPSWTDGGDFWAPEIHIVGKSYNLYYTARTSSHKLCIGIAYSDHILGPYIDSGLPLMQQDDLGIIDATYFK